MSWKKKSDFFICHWSHCFPPALSWLLYFSSVSPAGHYLYVLYCQITFTPVWSQLPFIPFLDFLTNSYMEWGDGRECWFSHLLFSMFYGTLEATLTARMLSCKKELPDQSNSPESQQCSPEVWQMPGAEGLQWWGANSGGTGEMEPHLWTTLGAPLFLRDWCKSPKTSHHALVISHQGIHHQDEMEAAFGKERDAGKWQPGGKVLGD